MRWNVTLMAVCLVTAGCGGTAFTLVPVSGIVTLDGQPLPNARIAFEPRAAPRTVVAGPGSYGLTDPSGRFTLASVKGQDGAVAGQHLVSISTYRVDEDPATGRSNVLSKERVPQRYQEPSELTFDVPNGGTDAADFHLTTQ